jgi:phosphatidylserine/phosphatidylglycerophosphate/cardiolipin synthase-like enzyme
MGAFNKITVEIEVLAPDLTVTDILCHDRSNQKNMVFGEGEIISIKAYVKNIGNDNATGFNVSFYYDFKNKEHLIERKYYKGIGRHRKYPSVRWDTKNMKPGWHTIFVVVDEENNVEERDETNNEFSIDVKIFKTTPSGNILITEIYYHTHANVRNEYIAIYNPSDTVEDVSGWYITDEPGLNMERQTKVVFPSDTVISPGEFLYLTQNASAFQKETGRLPDFEYMMDSREDVAQMQVCKRFTLSNKGGLVALKDRYNHTIDVVVYGEFYYNSGGWKGPPVEGSGCGNVLKRVFHLGEPVDTDSRGDWSHPRVYGIGQSNFEVVKLRCKGEIKMFVSPDCSFDTIIEELKKAQESIYLNIYEFTNHLLCNEIINALKRNVSVYIFLESNPVGNIDDNEIYILDRISANGGKIRFRVNDPEHGVYARYRLNHAKYLIIDNATVVVGSFNWGSTGLPENPRFGNREWGVVVRNEEIAEYFLKVFLDDWNPLRCDSYSFNDMDFSVPPHVIDEPMPSGIYEPCFDSKTITANFSATPVFSPDTSEEAICNLIEAANHSIYIEQLYIFKNWSGRVSPFVEKLVNKSKQGVEVKVLMNYNPDFKITSDKCMETKRYLEENNITVRFLYTNWSYFTSLHTKGMIVDNKSVVIASINWNENSVTKNRESGIIIENKGVARYYAEVFFHDWRLKPPGTKSQVFSLAEYKNPFLIVIIYGITFALVARDWRRRKWT